MFGLRLLWRFGDYRYFRQIAEYMKLKIPLVNQQIQIDQNVQCLVHGLKRIEVELPSVQQHRAETAIQSPEAKEDTKGSQTIQQPQLVEIKQKYIFQQNSQSLLNFDRALQVSKELGLDLCLIRQGSQQRSHIMSVSSVCKHVYSQYYLAHIKKKGKNGFKTIRLSDRITEHDIKIKYKNLKRMHEEGERKFRIQATNDSQKAEKVLIAFAKLFGKKVEPHLKTFRFAPHFRVEERWVCNIFFDQEIEVDPKQVNKKWRSYKFQQTYQKNNPSEDYTAQFEDENLEMERELYQTYKQLSIKLPEKFQKAADLETSMQSDKMAFFRSAAEEDQQDEIQWDDEEEQKFAEQQAKFNSEFFGERSIDEILTEMQELKRSGYQSEAFKVARFRQLKAELDQRLKKEDNEI